MFRGLALDIENRGATETNIKERMVPTYISFHHPQTHTRTTFAWGIEERVNTEWAGVQFQVCICICFLDDTILTQEPDWNRWSSSSSRGQKWRSSGIFVLSPTPLPSIIDASACPFILGSILSFVFYEGGIVMCFGLSTSVHLRVVKLCAKSIPHICHFFYTSKIFGE